MAIEFNTAAGDCAFHSLIDGSYNIAIGRFAGRSLVRGSHNILIGNDVDVPQSEISNYINICNLFVAHDGRVISDALGPLVCDALIDALEFASASGKGVMIDGKALHIPPGYKGPRR